VIADQVMQNAVVATNTVGKATVRYGNIAIDGQDPREGTSIHGTG
jgi:hypothetical protein